MLPRLLELRENPVETGLEGAIDDDAERRIAAAVPRHQHDGLAKARVSHVLARNQEHGSLVHRFGRRQRQGLKA